MMEEFDFLEKENAFCLSYEEEEIFPLKFGRNREERHFPHERVLDNFLGTRGVFTKGMNDV